MKLRDQQIKDRACTICDGLQVWGNGYRAASKKRCQTCRDGSNWREKSPALMGLNENRTESGFDLPEDYLENDEYLVDEYKQRRSG